MAILNVEKDIRLPVLLMDEFTSDFYDIRTKRFLKSDTNYLDYTIRLEGDFKKRYGSWLVHMNAFLDAVPADVPVYILWIPHQAQVNDYYYENMKKLGAMFNSKTAIQQYDYPFFSEATKDLSGYRNVKHLNPLTFFQTKDSLNSRLYFVNDPHINYRGNLMLSTYLKGYIPLKTDTNHLN
ncbi:hypothetical protein N7U66_10465 [Lacinutrix neustonica]|uniref:Uncharacterized protein n=1 Tax=Lacinutrix neustonica TaxID=2980107 RepID=A0A9E8SEQ5_9FLAO|nr:hypothetical protein [Lacinutrix neustonica]WAC03798.1 hypothetical protein N7U66_10465 [Lacinutrix neustonica]